MGRYYDDVVKSSLVGLDPANAFYGPLQSAANAVNTAEKNWYRRRRDMFDELDFGDDEKSSDEVEEKYANLKPGLSVYEFKSEFDRVNPQRKSASGSIRYVANTFDLSGITDGYADTSDTPIYEVEDEDEDGNLSFKLAEDPRILRYQVGRGKGNIDTLYTDMKAFTSDRGPLDDKDYYVQEYDEEEDETTYVRFRDVFRGFGEVPLAWNRKSDYSDQQLQVMNAAGNDYEDEVRPVIRDYETALQNYRTNGGGDLTEDFYSSPNPDFPYENFQGSDNSYNRPKDLDRDLIKETRGFGS